MCKKGKKTGHSKFWKTVELHIDSQGEALFKMIAYVWVMTMQMDCDYATD